MSMKSVKVLVSEPDFLAPSQERKYILHDWVPPPPLCLKPDSSCISQTTSKSGTGTSDSNGIRNQTIRIIQHNRLFDFTSPRNQKLLQRSEHVDLPWSDPSTACTDHNAFGVKCTVLIRLVFWWADQRATQQNPSDLTKVMKPSQLLCGLSHISAAFTHTQHFIF